MQIRPGIELGNLTDTGCHREKNEDYYCYSEPDDEQQFQRKGRLAVVADGMGGHEGGQVASSIAVETVRDSYLNHPSDDPAEALTTAFQEAHAAILEHARVHPELHGMGTTCTAVVVRDRQLSYCHVGDSRLYLIRGFSISQLTEDHSAVGRLVRDGVLTPEQAAVHPERNVLTAALGMDAPVPLDFPDYPMPLEPSDILLICSDGLHGLVGNEEMAAVAATSSPREACQELVRIAKDRGGFDNITVQILKVL
jgi:PPM family protein phosphatase